MKKPTEQTPYVFVYGTLMSGFSNNGLLKRATLIDLATTENDYVLVANGIPFLLEENGKSYVHGEVYKVSEDVLKGLDALEGHPNWYERKIVNVITQNGDRMKAWVYFIQERPRGYTVIESGSYRDYVYQFKYQD